jgi:hypothetical protein
VALPPTVGAGAAQQRHRRSKAKAFMPTILTTVAKEPGPIFRGQAAPRTRKIDRTYANTWEDARIAAEVNRIARKKVVIAALWTEVCGVSRRCRRSTRATGYCHRRLRRRGAGARDAVERRVQAGAICGSPGFEHAGAAARRERGAAYDVSPLPAARRRVRLGILYAKRCSAKEGAHSGRWPAAFVAALRRERRRAARRPPPRRPS